MNMQPEKEKIVLDTDADAAKKVTVTGWVSRHGRFYGDNENSARWDGCTHKACDCGNPMTKGWTKCDSCRSKSAIERYNAYPFQEWGEGDVVFDDNSDTYFFDTDEIDDYLDNNELEISDLRLVICKPNHLHQISSEYWDDILPEDGDVPKELKEKLEELNKFITTLKPVSWSPASIRTEYKRELTS